jgi:hypothetical protein
MRKEANNTTIFTINAGENEQAKKKFIKFTKKPRRLKTN